MATSKAAWGIEIGANAIKAIRLEREGDRATVSDFAVIPHKKVLSTPDLDQDEMVRLSLGQFISQKSLEGEHLVMSVPGHAAFARFAKLPPVEPKKVPDIVKFEAVQQIPFPIDEVEWDYQTFTSDDSPEIEVGIFAITRDRVQQRLGLYAELGVSPESLTLSPVALSNAMAYDLDLGPGGKPIIFLDIGTQATDVVIADEGRCWIRTFPLGGTHFTEAIASAFKLSYSKAEKLKKEASTSKYAKQIMQAMRPVFSDLLQDLQRSIGYYQSLHRENELEMMVGVGSTFKIPGLRKFIGQQLQINVVRLDEYKKIAVTGRQAAAFAENAVNTATAYGLALQGIGLAPIAANLVPVKALREQMWHSKTKWFAAAAAIIVAGAATTLYHPLTDRGRLNPTTPPVVERTLTRGQQLREEFNQVQADVGFTAENMRRLVDYRTIWPNIVADASEAMASTDPQPVLLESDVKKILDVEPVERRLVQLEHLAGAYVAPADAQQPRRIAVTMDVELSHSNPIKFLNDNVAKWLRDNAEPEGDRAGVPYRIIADTISCNPAQLQRLLADAAGGTEEQGRGGAPGRRPPRSGAAPPSERRPPTGGTRSPPGSRGGGSPGAPSMSGGGEGRREAPSQKRQPPGSRGGGSAPGFGGGGEGRREIPSQKRMPPGSRGGGGPSQPGFGGAPGPRAPGGRGTPGFGGAAGKGDAGGGDQSSAAVDLEALAPMPLRPSLYPSGATFFRVPVTFEIEIIDPALPRPAPPTASNPGSDERSHG
ncbi:MAG: type IV pilus assembly protein PilM [Planctomycetes bacterium]|nr:type IV pilus assembly protein PilM [Planctomycetota bacterium]